MVLTIICKWHIHNLTVIQMGSQMRQTDQTYRHIDREWPATYNYSDDRLAVFAAIQVDLEQPSLLYAGQDDGARAVLHGWRVDVGVLHQAREDLWAHDACKYMYSKTYENLHKSTILRTLSQCPKKCHFHFQQSLTLSSQNSKMSFRTTFTFGNILAFRKLRV